MSGALQSRANYIHFVEERYFGAVRRGDVAAVLACFAPGARLIGYHGDDPARVFARNPGPGENSLELFMNAAADFTLTYSSFVHFIDLEGQRVASHFSLSMVPRLEGARAQMPAREMRNCNFFQFDAGVLTHVVAYFSNPEKI